MTELHEAVKAIDVAKVRDILQRDPSCVNNRNADYETPLLVVRYNYGCRTQDNDRLQIIQMLLEYGADVDARNRNYDTPLHIAVNNNKIDAVKLLLERGANLNLRDDSNDMALHYVAFYGDVEIMEMLVQHGADVNAVGDYNHTPLDLAIFRCRLDGARILMDAGAKTRNLFNLNVFSESEIREFLKFIIEHGINLDHRFSMRTIYFSWVKSFDVKLIDEVMLEQRIDIDAIKREGKGMTELHVAAENIDHDRVQALLEAGANVNAKTIIGETPLHLLLDVKEKQNVDKMYMIAKLLIEAGADLNVQNYAGFTSFQLALCKYPKIIILMLARIAGVQENTPKNKEVLRKLPFMKFDSDLYPLAVAISLGYEEVVQRLIEKRHHIGMTNNENYESPLYYAVKWRRLKIVKILLEAGCSYDERYPHSIPFIDRDFLVDRNIKMICLLWEFHQDLIMKNTLIECVKDDVEPNLIIDLLVFYFAIGLRTKHFRRECTPQMEQFIRLRSQYSSLLDFHNNKLDKLKIVKVKNGVSLYDVLVKPLDFLIEFIQGESNLLAFKKLSSSLENKDNLVSFEHILKFRVELAIEKSQSAVHQAKNILKKNVVSHLETTNSNGDTDELAIEKSQSAVQQAKNILKKNIVSYLETTNSNGDADEIVSKMLQHVDIRKIAEKIESIKLKKISQ